MKASQSVHSDRGKHEILFEFLHVLRFVLQLLHIQNYNKIIAIHYSFVILLQREFIIEEVGTLLPTLSPQYTRDTM